MTPDERITAMHRHYGVYPDHDKRCASCSNLVSRQTNRTYHKCRLYGLSCSEATDWRVSNIACGMYGIYLEGLIPLLELLRRRDHPRVLEPIKGQLDMFGKEVGTDGNA